MDSVRIYPLFCDFSQVVIIHFTTEHIKPTEMSSKMIQSLRKETRSLPQSLHICWKKADATDLYWEFPRRKLQVNDTVQQKESYKFSLQLQDCNCIEV